MAWGLLASAVVHGALWLSWKAAEQRELAPRGALPAGPAVAMLAAAPAPPAQYPAQDSAPPLPAPALPPLPEVAAEPQRDAIRYYYPDELERQLILLRDGASDADVELPGSVIMHLFIDTEGKVADIAFEGGALPAALQDRLRAAFFKLEFVPGLKDGQPVPSRIKIRLQSQPEAAPR